MNKKLQLFAYLSGCFLLGGCGCIAGFPCDESYEIQLADNGQPAQPVAAPAPANVPAANNEFVNYTEVAADYREFGERTPRDQLVVQAGAGSNISAAIPPTIEEEVTDYEEEISISEGGESGNGSSGGEGLTEDPVEDWLAEEGKTLKGLLTEWSDRSGWRLIWNSNRNYTLTAGAMFRGRFADVSSALIRAFARARPAPIATFYKGNRVLVVETMEDENAYE